jgi:hypothetical protein
MTFVWVFNGANSAFPSAIFAERSDAEEWIRRLRLTGTLTKYPVGQSAYDWAIESGAFTPKSDKHRSPKFVASFTSAAQEHYYFEDGE